MLERIPATDLLPKESAALTLALLVLWPADWVMRREVFDGVGGFNERFAEIGLAGEIRSTTQASLRIREAAQMGFARCILPAGQAELLQQI